MKNLFIGHSYHKQTQSSKWFIELLKKHSTVLDLEWDDQWNGGPPVSIDKALSGGYENIIVWQVEWVTFDLIQKVPDQLLFVPMYDSCWELPDSKLLTLKGARILNFSWDQHTRAQRLGLQSLHTQYFPDPNQFEPVQDFSDLRGFFWFRRKELSWNVIKRLAAGSHWAKFYFHNAPDPAQDEPAQSHSDITPIGDDLKKFNIEISEWAKDRSRIEKTMQKANVFFASRLREGIGMSSWKRWRGGNVLSHPACLHIRNTSRTMSQDCSMM